MDLPIKTEQCESDSSDSSMDNMFPSMTIVLFGYSSSVQYRNDNILLGEKKNIENEISRIVPLERKISECDISVINMVDLHKTEHVDNLLGQLMNKNEIHAFIFVVPLGQLTNDDKMSLDWLQKVFGDKVLQFVMILFTYEGEEECNTVKDDLRRNPDLQQLLDKCRGRYQTCNKMMNNQSEMRDLMKKIEHLFNENQQQSYTGEMFKTASIRRKELENSEHRCGHTSETEPSAQLNLILLGKHRAGKSASGNTILGQKAFVKKNSKSVTREVAVKPGTVNGFSVTVYDTPGFHDPKMSTEEIQQILEKVIQKCESGLCVFLLVIKADNFTEEERETVEKIEKLLGEKRLEKTWILFTRGDELQEENKTIIEFINETEALKKLIQKYDQKYHVFNNKKKGRSDQARLLLVNILQRFLSVKDGGRLRRIPVISPNTHNEPDATVSSLLSRRIVLLGKSGVGKSAAGNTILGEKVFKSVMKMISVTSECSEGHVTVSDKYVSVVDTPGFFDTNMNSEELMKEIARSVYLSSPGPHAFLIVFPVNMRFTDQEQHIADLIEILFGQEVLKYSIVLFTHGDLLKEQNIEKLIEENCQLRHLVDQCGGRFHIFNNEDENYREQVDDLLQKIDTMIKQNGGEHYSNQMFEDALRFRQKEEKRRRREEEQRKQKEKQRQEETEIVTNKMKELEVHKYPEFEQFLTRYQPNFRMSIFSLGRHMIAGQLIGMFIGGALGAAFGLIGGPAGAVVGAYVGVGAGSIVGTALGAAVGKVRRNV
ncbi:GTPase IMAP family member 8 isoform X1 [Labeo rohita]|uniref:GTPase IMAP family member 8 isoform X1 n=2 Tax=Labeo rohita TaxID=84645 RepID=UPI0021E297EC|nr:GTPase IMAP family member 8 isoform X1 [Labeo rohita]